MNAITKFILKNGRKIPFVLPLTVLWAVVKALNVSTSVGSVAGAALMFLAVIVLALEFYRSGDIGLKTFGMDLAWSVLQLVVCTAVMTILISSKDQIGRISMADGLICFVVLIDAWFSPFNSFRTALRNWSAATAGGPSSPGGSE